MHKYGALEKTQTSDSATGGSIRVSTTARLRFRQMLPQYAEERNARINDRIAGVFVNASGNVLHYFKLGKGGGDLTDSPQELAEIRSGPAGDFFFISAIRGGYIDILTIQDNWQQPKNGKRRTERPKGPALDTGDSGGDISLAELASEMTKVATNKMNSDRNRRYSMSALRILANLANELDGLGATKAADEVTHMMEKRAKWPFGKKDEEDLAAGPKYPAMPASMDGQEESLQRAKTMNADTDLDLPNRVVNPTIGEPVQTTGPAGFGGSFPAAEVAPMAKPSEGRVIGRLGSITPNGDPYSYEYDPEKSSFRVMSYSYREGESSNPRAERAVGAYISRKNTAAWNVLSKYIPERSKSPADGRVLLSASTGDPSKDWAEAQIQFAGWVNSGYFGRELGQKFRLADPGMPMHQLMNAELPPEKAATILERFEAMVAGEVLTDLEDPASLIRYGKELQEWAALAGTNGVPAAGRELDDRVAPAEDFTLASMDSVDDMKKQASLNVQKLEGLFSIPGSNGPFGRD